MNGPNGDTPPQPVAQRTCAQCKTSKKKCDKRLPSCNRCLRLSIDCTYSDPERLNEFDADAADSRFEEVFARLRRIEAHIFPLELAVEHGPERGRLLMGLAQSHGIENPNPTNWTLEPGTLKPQYMSLILWQSMLATLDEHNATVQGVTRIYIRQVERWLPMVSNDKFQKGLALFTSLTSSDKFVLLVLAMHLVVSPPQDHPPAPSLAESPWYRKCKYHFSQYVAFSEPNIELIQAGMLIALFEFNHCIENRALTTLGICCRLAQLLDFDEVMMKHASQDLGKLIDSDEEIILTWMGLTRLERYFNMLPWTTPKSPSMPLHLDVDTSDCVSPYSGPPLSHFQTVDVEILSNCIYEYDAAQRNGRVQKFIRDNRYAAISAQLNEEIGVILRDLEEYIEVRNAQIEQDGVWAGMPVVLGAAIHIQCYFVAKQGTLDAHTMRSLHSYIGQLCSIIKRCHTLHGFEEGYLDGLQPIWAALLYHAVRAYKLVEETNCDETLSKIDTTVFIGLLRTMAPKYKIAETCLNLLGFL